MKKHLSLICLLAILINGCNQEEWQKNQSVSSKGKTFTASFELNESRTYVEGGNLLRWTTGDQISLFEGYTFNSKYQFDGETGDNGGTFSPIGNAFGTGNNLAANYAVYPYDSNMKITENGVISVTLPTEQNYAENSFGLGANTMVAITEDTDDTFLKFKNVGSYLKLQLYGDDVTVKSITLTGNNHEKIAGKATITPAYNQDPTISMADDATNSITLDCGDGVKIGSTAETATAFWMVVPPTVFEKGITVTMKDIKDRMFVKTTTKELVIERNVVKPMVTVKVKPESPYLTFIANDTQTLTMSKAVDKLEYSVDGGEWNELGTSTITFGGINGNLCLRGNNEYGTITGIEGSSVIFGNTTPVACTGDIRTLVDYENYSTANTTKAKFWNLFKDCSNLTSAPILPITNLAKYCYSRMFKNCTSLTQAPELPATTLTEYCYEEMFYGCTSLTQAPKLPATTLVDYCYISMFAGCTSLTQAPELLAKTLANYCYEEMFAGCTSLTRAPELPAKTLAHYCYTSMFANCTSLTQAPELPAKTLAFYCYGHMFTGCSSITQAPALPAKTLTTHCYTEMFKGCSLLNSITMLATNIDATNCLNNWVNGVSKVGTFTKVKEMTSLPEGINGIPDGWTVKNSGESNTTSSVTIETAGTLKSLLESNYLNLTVLKVEGPINGDDVYYLRKMLGGNDFSEANWGKLTTLDLTKATIVEGGEYYYMDSSKKTYYTSNNVIGTYMFYGCANLQKIYLPENLTSINSNTFTNCKSLETVNIPSGTIGSKSFNNSIALTSVTIGNGVTSIGSEAFKDCDALTSVTIGTGIENVLGSAFYDCDALISIDIFKGKIESSAFYSCDALKSVTIGEGVTDIGFSAFKECISLTSITIPNANIKENAFLNCTSLTSITLGEGVNDIGDGAFWNDNSINEIYCYATTPPSFTNFYDSIYYYASFSSNLKEEAILYVPTRCGTKYQSSSWGTFKNIIEMD